jgi:hypothetical protein
VAVDATRERLDAITAQLAGPWAESEERVVDTGSIPIVVHKRGRRYDLDDRGEAVARARALGAPREWLPIAEDVVDASGFNVNRRGVVFVPVVEGRDIPRLVARLSECAEAVLSALLDEAA